MLDVEDAGMEKHRKTAAADKCRAGATRELTLFTSWEHEPLFFDLDHSWQYFGHGRGFFFSAVADDGHK